LEFNNQPEQSLNISNIWQLSMYISLINIFLDVLSWDKIFFIINILIIWLSWAFNTDLKILLFLRRESRLVMQSFFLILQIYHLGPLIDIANNWLFCIPWCKIFLFRITSMNSRLIAQVSPVSYVVLVLTIFQLFFKSYFWFVWKNCHFVSFLQGGMMITRICIIMCELSWAKVTENIEIWTFVCKKSLKILYRSKMCKEGSYKFLLMVTCRRLIMRDTYG
jgi:hypothetical protein